MKVKSDAVYEKMEVDNAICKRRFHLVSEKNMTTVEEVNVTCPHCNASIYVAKNSSPVFLARDENLVKNPDGSRTLMSQCFFAKNS
ncbi:MAG: hypothetical protein K2X39_01730 [Silvanigrellaceae bacterium]|nr:hypothetical protein [Silvanigrellaceae bacterium]